MFSFLLLLLLYKAESLFRAARDSSWVSLAQKTHHGAARSESQCLICQSSQLFRDETLLNGPMPLILHLAKKSRWFFFPPHSSVDKKAFPCPLLPPTRGWVCLCTAGSTHGHLRPLQGLLLSQCQPEGKEGGMAPADSPLAPGEGWEHLTCLAERGRGRGRDAEPGAAPPRRGAPRGWEGGPTLSLLPLEGQRMAGSVKGTAEAQPECEGTSRLLQPRWGRQSPACCLSLQPGQLQLQGMFCCSPALSTAVQSVLPTPHSTGVPVHSSPSTGTQVPRCPRAPGQLYLADHFQHVPGGVPRPDDRQGRLVVGQAEPRGREVLVHPNITVGAVLVDAAQGHLLLPLQRQNPP